MNHFVRSNGERVEYDDTFQPGELLHHTQYSGYFIFVRYEPFNHQTCWIEITIKQVFDSSGNPVKGSEWKVMLYDSISRAKPALVKALTAAQKRVDKLQAVLNTIP